jgi:cyclic pyranopterin phosphate synthase
MVDVSDKQVSTREATASGDVLMSQPTAVLIQTGTSRKGDVLGVARLAAIQATKQTSTLIPLCHAIPIESVNVTFNWVESVPEQERGSVQHPSDLALLRCEVNVKTSAKTGVEMEALTAVSVGCLTVYDMVKAVERGMEIQNIRLLNKKGGKSGVFQQS